MADESGLTEPGGSPVMILKIDSVNGRVWVDSFSRTSEIFFNICEHII